MHSSLKRESLAEEDEKSLERRDWITSKAGHGYLLMTSWTQLGLGQNGERWWLKHRCVNPDDGISRGINDGDDDAGTMMMVCSPYRGELQSN